ncbi:MAG: HEPN domain-containing protein [Solirubrobacterales bacterium]|nr:HEPN domain-containing protein [Solirubrobacterales bacterium]
MRRRRAQSRDTAHRERALSSLASSREELAAARQLVETGFPRQATSRAYYAAFYAARAALEAAGISPPKTHSGLRARFSEFANATPGIGGEVGRALSQLETARTDADYGDPAMSADEANDAIAKAMQIVEVIERVISEG